MAITADVQTKDVAWYFKSIIIYDSAYSGTSVYGPSYTTNTSSGRVHTYSYQKNVNEQYTGNVVTLRTTHLTQTGTIFKPDLQYNTVTGYTGTLSFDAEASGKIVILRSDYTSYNYDTLVALAPSFEFVAGHNSFTFANSIDLSDAINYGMMPYQTNIDTVPPGQTSVIHALRNGRMNLTYTNAMVIATVAAVRPANETILAENENLFFWSYNHPTNIPQTAWKLHMIIHGVDSVVMSGEGSNTFCAVPPNTLEVGTAQWYVSVECEEAGYTLTAQSSPVYIIIRSNPSTSDITVDDKPRLTVGWTAYNQQAAQVRVGETIYPTIFTSGGSFTLPEVLSNGVYPVSVRTQNTLGDWSEWAETIYANIQNEPPTGALSPLLDYSISNTIVTLTWTAVSGSQTYILYRNGEPIYAGDSLTYIDTNACGLSEYTVRALYADGYYIDSDTQLLSVAPPADMLLHREGERIVALNVRHHPQYPVREWDESADIELKEYAGRTLPVAVSDGHMTRSLTLTAAYRSPQEAAALLAMLGKTVIYKSKKGESCRGVVVSASRESSLTDAVTYRISATDDDERAWLT